MIRFQGAATTAVITVLGVRAISHFASEVDETNHYEDNDFSLSPDLGPLAGHRNTEDRSQQTEINVVAIRSVKVPLDPGHEEWLERYASWKDKCEKTFEKTLSIIPLPPCGESQAPQKRPTGDHSVVSGERPPTRIPQYSKEEWQDLSKREPLKSNRRKTGGKTGLNFQFRRSNSPGGTTSSEGSISSF